MMHLSPLRCLAVLLSLSAECALSQAVTATAPLEIKGLGPGTTVTELEDRGWKCVKAAADVLNGDVRCLAPSHETIGNQPLSSFSALTCNGSVVEMTALFPLTTFMRLRVLLSEKFGNAGMMQAVIWQDEKNTLSLTSTRSAYIPSALRFHPTAPPENECRRARSESSKQDL